MLAVATYSLKYAHVDIFREIYHVISLHTPMENAQRLIRLFSTDKQLIVEVGKLNVK